MPPGGDTICKFADTGIFSLWQFDQKGRPNLVYSHFGYATVPSAIKYIYMYVVSDLNWIQETMYLIYTFKLNKKTFFII